MPDSVEALDFGKYKGMTLDDVPIDYIIFLAGYRLVGVNKRRCTSPAAYWVERHRPLVRERAIVFLTRKCWSCGGRLQAIGTSRENGTLHDDWEGRVLHKKCWKELMNECDE